MTQNVSQFQALAYQSQILSKRVSLKITIHKENIKTRCIIPHEFEFEGIRHVTLGVLDDSGKQLEQSKKLVHMKQAQPSH